jgi:CheY-like chemotaxis protein
MPKESAGEIGPQRAHHGAGGYLERYEVLVVEDNGADRFWLEYVLQSLGVDCAVFAVTDGEQAVDFLLKHGQYVHAPTPCAIFLDVHLPKMDGLEVLRNVPNAQELPICVVTSSEAERAAFQKEFGIPDSNYLLKPVSQAGILGSACFRDHLNRLAKN